MIVNASIVKPGQLVLIDGATYALQYVSTAPPPTGMSVHHRLHSFAGIGRARNEQPGTDRLSRWIPPDFPIELVTTDLTAAQLHAGELLALIRECRPGAGAHTDWERRAFALLDKIDPPPPPTVDEFMKALDDMINSPGHLFDQATARARQLLKRAKAAQPKEPQ